MDKERRVLTHKTEFYSALKENEMMSVTGKWMALESIMLSKAGQMQTDTACFSNVDSGRRETEVKWETTGDVEGGNKGDQRGK